MGIENEEKLILEVLAKNELIKKNTTTTELNNKLGIEKKPVKIQNNVRAMLIGNINKKFNVTTTANEELIERIRSEFDKRFFEYKLNRRYAQIIAKLFE
jgi:DNA anti-recombination protein RmuC